MESLLLQGPRSREIIADGFRGDVSYYIETRRDEISRHPAVADAVRGVSVENRQLIRRQSSLTALSENKAFSLEVQQQRAGQNTALAATQPATIAARDPLKDYRHSIDEEKTLKKAVDAFRAHVKNKKKLALIDPFSKEGHTWSSVIETLQQAAIERQKAATFWGKIGKSVSKFLKNNAKTLEQWQELLPSGSEYFSVICGFLKLIFGAAAALGDVADEIRAAVEKIPEVIERALDLMNAFMSQKLSPDSKLFTKSDVLFTSLFQVMIEVMFELKKNWFKRELVAFFQQETYGQGLRLAIKAADDNTDKFISLANDYGLALTAESNKRILELQQQANRIEDKQFAIYQETQAQGQSSRRVMADGFSGLERDNWEILRRQEYFAQRQEELEQKEEEREKRRLIAEAQQRDLVFSVINNLWASNPMLNFNSGEVKLEDQEIKRLRVQNFERRRPSVVMHQIKVTLDRLSFSDDTITHDVRAALARAVDMKRGKQDRAIAILENAVFQRWIVTVKSSVLSVNANCIDPSDNEPSSYVSARLASAITPLHTTVKINTRRPLCLAFFCAEHTADDDVDPDAGPAGMMRNMISQLMSQYRDFDLETMRRIQNTNPFSTIGLLRCLRALLAELPGEVIVYLIIDSIVRFEDSPVYNDETATLLPELRQLVVGQQGIRATLKMLFLDPARCLMLDETLAEAETEVLSPLVRSTEGLRLRTLVDNLGDAAYERLIE